MHTGTLTGHVTGKNRQELINTATKEAVAYYGCPPDNIEITLTNETAEGFAERRLCDANPGATHVWYTADYQARINPRHHREEP